MRYIQFSEITVCRCVLQALSGALGLTFDDPERHATRGIAGAEFTLRRYPQRQPPGNLHVAGFLDIHPSPFLKL
jgi:hypothetical protein